MSYQCILPYSLNILSTLILKASNLVKEAKFYVSLAYGAVAYSIGARAWYDRISDNLVLGALPILPAFDSIRQTEKITHVISMVEPFEVKSFVLGPNEAKDRGLNYLSLPVKDFTGVPTDDQVCFPIFFYIMHVRYHSAGYNCASKQLLCCYSLRGIARLNMSLSLFFLYKFRKP